MPSIDIPTEVVECFIECVDDYSSKKATALACRRVARSWAHISTQFAFDYLRFKDWDDILCFLTLLSGPTPSTFPTPIKSRRVALENLTAIGQAHTSALQRLMALIPLPDSLDIHVTTGSITDILAVVNQQWINISQVTLSGGIHPPAPLFAWLESFPQLKSMIFQGFQLEGVENGHEDESPAQFSFPGSLVKLSLDRSTALWPFFKAHVLPGGGLANIQELHIRSPFSLNEEGVLEMIKALRKIQGIRTLKLEGLNEASDPHLKMDILRGGFGRPRDRIPLARIPGLQVLQLDLTNVPAEVSLDCIGTYCFYLPTTSVDISVEIEVPRSVRLWAESDPSTLMAEILDGAQSAPVNAAINARSPLVVKGFPGKLPPEVEALGRATVCGYPVTFVGSAGEDAGM